MLEIEVGNIVKSLHGRDENNYYVVKSIDKDYLFLVDGKGKTILKPKKKKIKHICATGYKSDILKSKFTSGMKVLDAEIRKVISNIDCVK